MKVAFMHLDIPGQPDARRLAEIMVASVRKNMPQAHLIQFADDATPIVQGAHEVRRKPLKYPWLMLYRLNHFRSIEAGEWMFIDTDAVVQRDVSHVFAQPFDVALTRRKGPIYVDGKDIVPEMPYNTGVMFTRGPEFWRDVYDHCSALSDKLKHWFGDQMAVRVVAEAGAHKVLELTCDEYNYSPSSAAEDVEGRYVVHYKGGRKKIMLDKYKETQCA